MVVCSQEIAASTTQLVVASKVKAPRGNKHLHELAEASKGVTEATGQVVASAKTGAQLIDEAGEMILLTTVAYNKTSTYCTYISRVSPVSVIVICVLKWRYFVVSCSLFQFTVSGRTQ